MSHDDSLSCRDGLRLCVRIGSAPHVRSPHILLFLMFSLQRYGEGKDACPIRGAISLDFIIILDDFISDVEKNRLGEFLFL